MIKIIIMKHFLYFSDRFGFYSFHFPNKLVSPCIDANLYVCEWELIVLFASSVVNLSGLSGGLAISLLKIKIGDNLMIFLFEIDLNVSHGGLLVEVAQEPLESGEVNILIVIHNIGLALAEVM